MSLPEMYVQQVLIEMQTRSSEARDRRATGPQDAEIPRPYARVKSEVFRRIADGVRRDEPSRRAWA